MHLLAEVHAGPAAGVIPPQEPQNLFDLEFVRGAGPVLWACR